MPLHVGRGRAVPLSEQSKLSAPSTEAMASLDFDDIADAGDSHGLHLPARRREDVRGDGVPAPQSVQASPEVMRGALPALPGRRVQPGEVTDSHRDPPVGSGLLI